MIFKPQALQFLEMNFSQKLDLLFKLGYFISEELPDFSTLEQKVLQEDVRHSGHSKFVEAVKKFQEFYGADVDGDFGKKTTQVAEMMLANRYCNHPDISPLAKGGPRRWGFNEVTYGHELHKLPGVDPTVAHEMYVASWERWGKESGLDPKYTEDIKNANVQAYVGRIDGRGGTLALSYLPGNGSPRSHKLTQKYDRDDRWAGNPHFQLEVETHENGHALGLDHDSRRDSKGLMSIMHPSAIGVKKLNANDIKNIVARHGKPKPADPTKPPVPQPDPPHNPFASEIVLTEGNGKIRTFTEHVDGWIL